jgi:uncharacterized protein
LAEFVVNTSPLQYLHLLGRLDLLPALAARVLVPPAVVQELAVGRAKTLDLPDPTRCEWIAVRVPGDLKEVERFARLGAGEREVLALARETSGSLALLDDLAARRAAAILGVPVRGTLGLLLDAKAHGLIRTVEPFLGQLRSCGFRLSAETACECLRRAGEAP